MTISRLDHGTIHLKEYSDLNAEFLLMRKEARCVLQLFLDERQKLRAAERAMGILDAKGKGQGLPRDEIYIYHSHLTQSRFCAGRMKNLAATLAAYGHRLIELMDALSPLLSIDQRLSLISAKAQGLPGEAWKTSPLFQLVTRYKAEDSSAFSRGVMGPLQACVLASRGDLIATQQSARQAAQLFAPAHPAVGPLTLVASR
ncbi:hypothetical protein [Pseudomonas sp. Irchel 3E13]|uniref:hypothetical protein n=1 Tax=Pseudomonas sp. Irchel 3E13 TaxID=2008975 RepID=UPI000BA4C169|nr:hypothetical protein [Pseudomonas sp. Irchel 3E13]